MRTKSSIALDVECPYCGAARRQSCWSMDNRPMRKVSPHRVRYREAGVVPPKHTAQVRVGKNLPHLTKYLPGKRGARKFLRCQGRKADGTQCDHTIHKCRSHENHRKAVADMCAQMLPEPTM